MMKRVVILSLAILITLAVMLAGCDILRGHSDQDYTIQVVGTEGLEFWGTYEVTTSEGQTISYSVEGTVPAEYDMTGRSLNCRFGKSGDNEDLLHIAIVGEGEIITDSQTSDPYGMVIIIMQ